MGRHVRRARRRGRARAHVFHCFTGGPDEARRCLDLGAFLQLHAASSRSRRATDVQAAAQLVPARPHARRDRQPVPRAGARTGAGRTSRPMCRTSAQFIADLRDMPVDDGGRGHHRRRDAPRFLASTADRRLEPPRRRCLSTACPALARRTERLGHEPAARSHHEPGLRATPTTRRRDRDHAWSLVPAALAAQPGCRRRQRRPTGHPIGTVPATRRRPPTRRVAERIGPSATDAMRERPRSVPRRHGADAWHDPADDRDPPGRRRSISGTATFRRDIVDTTVLPGTGDAPSARDDHGHQRRQRPSTTCTSIASVGGPARRRRHRARHAARVRRDRRPRRRARAGPRSAW